MNSILLYRIIVLNGVRIDYWLLDGNKLYLDVWKYLRWREDGIAK